MDFDSYTNRWWENYLVRYFMPSIAGIVIVSFLVFSAPQKMQSILFFNTEPLKLNSQTLVLLVLYGNLFCYISSYPILCFHVTRSIDFSRYKWRHLPIDGYLSSISTGILLLIVLLFGSNAYQTIYIFIVAFIFSASQMLRIHASLKRGTYKGLAVSSSNVFAYMFSLSLKRTVRMITKKRDNITANKTHKPNTSNQNTEETSQIMWHKSFVESYRHLREHGNSAFIFFLETVLASLCYPIFSNHGNTLQYQMSLLAVLLSLWSLPAIFIHLVGQHLERRFSRFDKRF